MSTWMKRAVAIAYVMALAVLPKSAGADDVRAIMEAYAQDSRGSAASTAAAVIQDREIRYQAHHGYADIALQVLADEDTVYEWGSCTKLLVWVSVMQLWEAGLIDLEADIRQYLPEGFLTKLRYDQPITMLHLMNHTAGWQDTMYDFMTKDASRNATLEHALRDFEPEQVFAPGTVCAYSNWGCALAGYIVERLAGEPFYAYVQQRIFAPLHMTHTGLAPDLADNPWVQARRLTVLGYLPAEDGLTLMSVGMRYILLYPSGMATGTLADFARFAVALIPADGAESLLFEKPDTLERMLQPTLFYADGRTPRVSHGLWTLGHAKKLLWHSGGTVGFSSLLCIDPAGKTALVVLANQYGEQARHIGLLSQLYGEDEPESRSEEAKLKLGGFYRMARAQHVGMLRMESYISDPMLLMADAETGDYRDLLANGLLKHVGGERYVTQTPDGADQFFEAALAGGQLRLETIGTDYLKTPIGAYVLLALGVLGMLLAVLALICAFVGFVWNRIRRRAVDRSRAVVWRLLTQLAMVGMGLTFAALFAAIADGTPIGQEGLAAKGLAFALLALAPVCHAVTLVVWRESRRPMSIATAIFGLAVSANVVYYQLYNFWQV